MRGIVICRRTRFQNTRGAGAKYVGVMTGKAGGKFDSSRCGGHKNSENAATFSKILGQEDKLSPAPATSRHVTRQAHPAEEHYHAPQTKAPSQNRQNTPITTTIPLSGGRNCTGRVKTSPKKGAVGERSGSTDKKGGEKFRPGRCGEQFHAAG